MTIQLHAATKKLLLLLSLLVMANAAAEESATPAQPPIKDLGGNKYQVGEIIIDKNKGQFRVPGKVLRIEPPLEFLAVTKGGYKAYESMFELYVNAIEFNLACILIGLDTDNVKLPKFHFDTTPVQGDAVGLHVEWQQQGKTLSVPVAEFLNEGDEAPAHPKSDWVYTGSGFSPQGKFLAELTGVLVSFVHTPTSVIEHRTGVGLGNYGAVSVSDEAPAVGTAVVFVVNNTAAQ